MKKTLLFLLSACAAGVGIDAKAQRSSDFRQEMKTFTEHTELVMNEYGMMVEKPVKTINYSRDEEEIFYSDDFSDPSLWEIASEGQGQWEILTETPAQMVQFMGGAGMQSTTADNGYGTFNGIQFLLAGSVDPQDATLTHTESFSFIDEPDVAFQFEQRYRAFNTDVVSFEISVDQGETWTQFVVNGDLPGNDPAVQNTVVTVISSVAGNQPDVRVRFRWQNTSDSDQFGSGYGWMVDDMAFTAAPQNYLFMHGGWYNKWVTIDNPDIFNELFGSDIEFVNSFEYSDYRDNQVRPLSFTADVSNLGSQPQTNVTFTAVLTDPDGNSETFTHVIPELAPGERTFMVIDDAMPAAFNLDDPEQGGILGQYTVSFSVEQDEEEEFPEDSFVSDKIFRVDEEYMSNNGATLTYPSTWQGSEFEALSRYSFTEPMELEYIQFAMTTGDVDPEVALFETINLDVEIGSMYEDSFADFIEFFPEDNPLSLFITSTDLFNESPVAAADANWVTVFFPEPIQVEPGLIYNAVLQVGTPPDAPGTEDGFIWPMRSLSRNTGASLFAGTIGGDAAAFFIGTQWLSVRLGSPVEEDVISTENMLDLRFRLGQNYPNPADGMGTNIDWELFEPGKNIQFVMHDMNGRVIEQRDLGDRPAGKQETIRINTDLAAGVYQYQLIVGDHRAVRKMVIAK